ncbi:MAG: hypothetical protein UDO44_12745 [Prevotella sp.]|nr:hypothetical protein [Prevotella sp.]
MLNLCVERMIRERGTIMGLLKAENVNDSEFDEQVKVCGTVERAADCLPVGKYRVLIGKCIYHRRKMPFLVPMEEVSSSMESSKGLCVLDSSQCELCCKARHSHEFGDISAFTSLPCAMIQPGNGPFTMNRGSILVGEVHAPGYVLKSQPLFNTLYERIKKAVWRGNEVTLEIKEV